MQRKAAEYFVDGQRRRFALDLARTVAPRETVDTEAARRRVAREGSAKSRVLDTQNPDDREF
jgi:hypothetical protein